MDTPLALRAIIFFGFVLFTVGLMAWFETTDEITRRRVGMLPQSSKPLRTFQRYRVVGILLMFIGVLLMIHEKLSVIALYVYTLIVSL